MQKDDTCLLQGEGGGITRVGEGTPDFLCGGSQGSHEPDLEPSPSVT